MYSYYITYWKFLEEYPRFKSTQISFDVLKSKIPRIIRWFGTDDCYLLDNENPASANFWKKTPSSLKSFENAYENPKKRNFEEIEDDNSYNPEMEIGNNNLIKTPKFLKRKLAMN
jgi:hypothetical protein